MPECHPPKCRDEVARDDRYPLSRWYLRPLARCVADRLVTTSVRPWHVSLGGCVLALAAAIWLATLGPSLGCALLILAAWFCDRVDGTLARRLQAESPRGAWLDANLDELADVAWHVAAAAWLARSTPWAWPLAVGMVSGKFLFFYGLHFEASLAGERSDAAGPYSVRRSLASTLYHLPGNADFRLHALVLAVALGWLGPELLFFAAYYQARWLARYALVLRRLPDRAPSRPETLVEGIPDAAVLREIGVALVVRDEAHHFAELLPLLSWSDEIVVVVDDRTIDASAAVAEAFGCRVYRRRFETFAAQRNFALDRVTRPWVLSIDADERPTVDLLAEIGRRIVTGAAAAFRVPIRSRILGHPFRFSGTQDDQRVRLWRRGAARWQGAVHERLVVAGPVETLDAALNHDTLPTRAALKTKIERYTDLAARDARLRPAGLRGRSPAYAALREFARRWLWKQGFRDGPAGLEFALWSAYSEWVLTRKFGVRSREASSAYGLPLGSDA